MVQGQLGHCTPTPLLNYIAIFTLRIIKCDIHIVVHGQQVNCVLGAGDSSCQCDLLVDQCDVLCCCDRDCSVSSRMVFNCSTSRCCLDISVHTAVICNLPQLCMC